MFVQNVPVLDESSELSSIRIGLLSAPSSALRVTELDRSGLAIYISYMSGPGDY